MVLKIKKFHLDTVYLIGYSIDEDNNKLVKFKDSILLSPFQTEGEAIEFKINENANFIYFKPQNTVDLEVKGIYKKMI